MQRPCPGDGGRCPEVVTSGCCPKHTRAVERRRGSAASRGYDAEWFKLRARFRRELIRLDIAPVCGARLPGTRLTKDSRCAAEGLEIGDLPGKSLHVDHIEPHHGDEVKFKDMANLQYLCRECHSAKTLREARGRA
jgi:5-methylcytosine-specific restriction protein A